MTKLKYLGQYKIDDLEEVLPRLMGVYRVKHDSSVVNVADNLVNRIIMGLPLWATPQKHIELSDTTDLYDYQVEDVRQMINCKGFLNRNKPGYGKTIEAIYACKNIQAKSVLVIAPNPTVYQWVKQFKKWWPERIHDIIQVTSKTVLSLNKIYIVNPEKILSKTLQHEFYKLHFDVLVVDEAHMLKNRQSQRSKAIKCINATYRWALTGTPVLKNPADLWSILDFLSPSYAGSSYWAFVRYFCKVEQTFFGEQITGLTENPVNVAILQKLLGAISCYHPHRGAEYSKQIIVVRLQLTGKQKSLYNKVKKLVHDELSPELTIANGAVLTLRLLQVTSAPIMYDESIPGVKFEWLRQFLEDNPDEKIVVYSKFEKVLSSLEVYLSKNGVSSVLYTGKVSSTMRTKALKDFSENSKCRVILGTINALGVGVDSLQKSAHICVFLDRDYISEINSQCEDRLNRIGQKEEVICYYLECENTWDIHVAKANKLRSEDIRRLLTEDL